MSNRTGRTGIATNIEQAVHRKFKSLTRFQNKKICDILEAFVISYIETNSIDYKVLWTTVVEHIEKQLKDAVFTQLLKSMSFISYDFDTDVIVLEMARRYASFEPVLTLKLSSPTIKTIIEEYFESVPKIIINIQELEVQTKI